MRGKLVSSTKLNLVLLVVTFLLLLSLLLVGNIHPLLVSAQAPTGTPSAVTIDTELLAVLGLTAEEIESARALATDLEIIKTTGVTTVTAGDSIVYNITVNNTNPTDSAVVFFYDDYPSQLQNVAFSFSRPATTTTIFNNPKPTYVLEDPLPANQSVLITVSGILTSAVDVTVTNTATATDLFGGSQSDSVNVNIESAGGPPGSNILYFPFIAKSEPILLAYSENFNSGTPWFEFDSNGCKTDHQAGQYWVDVDSTDRECLPPAKNENKPESPYRTYGEFQVDGYISGEDQSENFWYGLFINGAGAGNYYLFRIQPNEDNCNISGGGDWELRRRKDSNETIIASGSCHPSIRRGYGIGATNTVKIRHTSDRNLSVYVNGTLLGSVTEPNSSQHLTFTGPGLYVRSSNRNVLVKFDNYQVYKFN